MFARDFRSSHKTIFDIIYFIGFLALIIVGALVINSFVFRSFNVVGPSMEPTLMPDDRLVINKIPRTIAHLKGQDYVPDRGQIVVLKIPYLTVAGPMNLLSKE